MINEQTWHKSSYSGGEGNCVEAIKDQADVRFRDSKLDDGPEVTVSGSAWSVFLDLARQS
ncbi:DUF397 domain-containing protein [Streptomyces varsoviensis]|uniref:DUF397 domain-containing protein n=1 Tax=Streptomyces varsoviensis TaxID=67373 RepID=UPI0033D28AC6